MFPRIQGRGERRHFHFVGDMEDRAELERYLLQDWPLRAKHRAAVHFALMMLSNEDPATGEIRATVPGLARQYDCAERNAYEHLREVSRLRLVEVCGSWWPPSQLERKSQGLKASPSKVYRRGKIDDIVIDDNITPIGVPKTSGSKKDPGKSEIDDNINPDQAEQAWAELETKVTSALRTDSGSGNANGNSDAGSGSDIHPKTSGASGLAASSSPSGSDSASDDDWTKPPAPGGHRDHKAEVAATTSTFGTWKGKVKQDAMRRGYPDCQGCQDGDFSAVCIVPESHDQRGSRQ